jgi:hypothetical protein
VGFTLADNNFTDYFLTVKNQSTKPTVEFIGKENKAKSDEKKNDENIDQAKDDSDDWVARVEAEQSRVNGKILNF